MIGYELQPAKEDKSADMWYKSRSTNTEGGGTGVLQDHLGAEPLLTRVLMMTNDQPSAIKRSAQYHCINNLTIKLLIHKFSGIQSLQTI